MRARWACLAWAGALAAALAFAGCADDRRAGTEVGNPEMVAVFARFISLDSAGEAELNSLHLRVMNMTYRLDFPGHTGDTDTCWSTPNGTLVNLSGWDPAPALPDTSVPDGDWHDANMLFRAPEGSASLPAIDDFDLWSDPHYAKFHIDRVNGTLAGLFEMPRDLEFSLGFNEKTVDSWRWVDTTMWVDIYFNVGHWLGGVNVRGPWTTRADGRGRPFVLFSPAENAAAWADLKARLPQAFLADTIRVR